MNTYKPGHALVCGLLITLLTTLPGCATKKPGEPMKLAASSTEEYAPTDGKDPLEFLNRGLFRVHEVLDGLILKPAAHIYRGVMPEAAQTSIKNALTNLASPVVLLNSVLQGDARNAEHTVERFVVNSTVGIAGLFDVASDMGIEKTRAKDFGQTLGVYGVGTGPYIFLPLLGPSDARDTLGLVADFLSDPTTYILTRNELVALDATRGVVKRTTYLPLTDRVYRDSFDPYATFRSIYLQHRAKAVRDYLSQDTGWEKETGK